jgi:hypothetical protein
MASRHASDRDAVISRLRRRYGDRFAAEEIADAVHAAFDNLAAHAKFQAYLPVLAERAAADRLAELVRQSGPTVDGVEAANTGFAIDINTALDIADTLDT